MSDNVLSFAILDQLSSRLTTLSISDLVSYTVKQTLKQVAHDYDLSYKELKVAYMESDVNIRDNLPEPEPEAEPTPEPTPKPKPKAKAKKSVLKAPGPKPVKAPEPVKAAPAQAASKTPLSKMKKDECISECRRLGLSTEGTVPQLRERIKNGLKGGPPPTESAPVATESKKGGGSKKKKSKEAKPAHSHALTEEVVDGCEVCETHGNVLAEEETDEEYREEGEELTLAERLKRLLAAHGDTGDEEDIGEDGDPDYEPGELQDYDETQLVEA